MRPLVFGVVVWAVSFCVATMAFSRGDWRKGVLDAAIFGVGVLLGMVAVGLMVALIRALS